MSLNSCFVEITTLQFKGGDYVLRQSRGAEYAKGCNGACVSKLCKSFPLKYKQINFQLKKIQISKASA